MIHIRIRKADGTYSTDLALEDLHALVEDQRNLIWLDLESPTPDEVGLVASLLKWEHLTVEDLTRQGQRAKLEHFDEYAHLVMHMLVYEGEPRRLDTPEIDLVVGGNYVASVHYLPLPHITEAREVAQHTEAILEKGPDYLLYVLTDRLVDSYFPILDEMHEEVDDLEDKIVTDPSQSLLSRIFDMKRDAIALRKVISPQLEVFTRLTAPGLGIVSEPYVMHFRDVHDHLIRVFEAMDTYRELMSGALDAYLSNVSNRMNEVMKRLTIVAALFLPVTFITGLFGMNLRRQPPWTDTLFWGFLAMMLVISLAQWVYFARKGWI